MHKHFADWYHRASLVATGDQLKARWGGVSTFVENVGKPEVLDLVRLYVRLSPHGKDFIDGFQKAIKDQDAAFLMADNSNELSVLAGAGLVVILKGEDVSLADIAALALDSIDFSGAGLNGPFNDVVDIARMHLSERRAKRSKPVERALKSDDTLNESLKALKAALPGNNPQQIGDPTYKAFQTLETRDVLLQTEIENLWNALRAYREEADIAWWIMGEHSRTLEKPLAELGSPASAVVCGYELADLVEVIPGPYGASSLLGRMLSTSGKNWQKPVSVKNAISDIPLGWRKLQAKRPSIDQVIDLTPITAALFASISTAVPDWVLGFEAASKLSIAETLAPSEIAMRSFTECMLLRAYGE